MKLKVKINKLIVLSAEISRQENTTVCLHVKVAKVFSNEV